MLIKVCLNETYSTVRVGSKRSPYMFPIRNALKLGYVLSPLFFNFALEYAMKMVQVPGRLKLNGTHQLFVYADDVDIWEGSVHTVNKNTEALVVASKATGLEVNADKTKCTCISRNQNARLSQNLYSNLVVHSDFEI